MERKNGITRMSAAEMQAMEERGESLTDWAFVENMTQEEADRRAEAEDGPLPEGWWDTVVWNHDPMRKTAVSVRLDDNVLAWFKAGGPGYQTRINAVLSQFVHARQKADAKG